MTPVPARAIRFAPPRVVAWFDGWQALAVVIGAAFAVRLAHLFDLSRLPIFDRPTVDAALYLDMARNLAHDFLSRQVFYKPPLYPYLLALAWRAVGDNAFLLRFPGVCCGAATAGLVWWLGRRLFDARIAFVAGLLYGMHRTAVYFDGELLEIGVVTLLHTLALVCVLRADGSTTGRWHALLAGLALGLGTVARPTLLLFDAVALAWLGRRRLLPALLGLGLAIAPVTLHNAFHGHDFVLVSANLGVNFHLGNNPRADGRIAASDALPANPAAAERSARTLAEGAAGRPLRPSQVSDYWLRRGLDYDLGHPQRAAGLLVRKLCFAWNAAEISDNDDLAGLCHWLHVYRILPVGTWLLAPCGLAGLWLVPRRRDRTLARGFIGAQIASLLPFFIVARFRLPWMPALAPFAAWTLVQLVRRAAGFRRLVAVTAGAAVCCSVPVFGVRAPVDFDLDYKIAYAYQQRGEFDAALAAYRDAIRRNPRDALACNALGVLLADRGGDATEAAHWITEAIALDPARSANYRESLAGVQLRRGDPAAALAACTAGLAAEPDDPTRAALLLRQAEAYRALGDATHEAAALRAAVASGLPAPRAAEATRRLGELAPPVAR